MKRHPFAYAWLPMAAAFIVLGGVPIAAEKITIEEFATGKVQAKPLALSGYSGDVASTLEFDLYVAGFEIVPEASAEYVLKGGNAGRVEGRLQDLVSQATLFAKAYDGGSPRFQAHALADEVVQAVWGQAGVARTKIAFKVRQNNSGGPGEIYVADYDGLNASPVTSDGVIVGSPRWVPGRRMLVYMSHKLGSADLLTQDLETGKRNILTRYPGADITPAVSPDGRRVAMILSKGGSTDLYVCNLDGTGLRQLTHTREIDTSPCWSPDGRTICYVTRMDGRRVLATISPQGGSARRLEIRGGYIPAEPNWSPDGQWIAFTSERGGFSVCIVPAGGGDPTRLTAGEDPCWAPNSRTLVFTRRVGEGRRVLSLLDVPTKHQKDVRQSIANSSQPSWAH